MKRKTGRAFQREFNKIKPIVAERDDYACRLCGYYGKSGTPATQVHHIIFRSRGGTNDPSNLICLCLSCHEKAHGRNGGNERELREIMKRLVADE